MTIDPVAFLAADADHDFCYGFGLFSGYSFGADSRNQICYGGACENPDSYSDGGPGFGFDCVAGPGSGFCVSRRSSSWTF